MAKSKPSLEIVVFRVPLKTNFGLSQPERQDIKYSLSEGEGYPCSNNLTNNKELTQKT